MHAAESKDFARDLDKFMGRPSHPRFRSVLVWRRGHQRHTFDANVMPSRRQAVLQTTMALAGLAATSACRVLGAAARSRAILVPSRFGARADGERDDTLALQSTVDAAGDEAEVRLARGVYRVNADVGVQLRTGTTLRLDDGAVLKALPTGASNSNILLCRGVKGVRISGGLLLGERGAHLGGRGEFGMGIGIYGATDVVIEDIRVEACWGDGVYVGYGAGESDGESRNIVVRRLFSIGNRRQGMSITGCRGALIEDCSFVATEGTLPQSGLDMEPDDRRVVERVTVRRCRFEGNRGHGIMTSGNFNVRDIEIDQCVAVDNHGDGIRLERAFNSHVSRCESRQNGGHGILIAESNQNSVRKNRFSNNAVSSNGSDITLSRGASDNVVEGNVCGAPTRAAGSRVPDISVHSIDCQRNVLRANIRSDGGDAEVLDKGKETQVFR